MLEPTAEQGADISPTPPDKVCEGAPQFIFSVICPTNNNDLFGMSGSLGGGGSTLNLGGGGGGGEGPGLSYTGSLLNDLPVKLV